MQDLLLQEGQNIFCLGMIHHIKNVMSTKQKKDTSDQVGTLKHQTLLNSNEVLGQHISFAFIILKHNNMGLIVASIWGFRWWSAPLQKAMKRVIIHRYASCEFLARQLQSHPSRYTYICTHYSLFNLPVQTSTQMVHPLQPSWFSSALAAHSCTEVQPGHTHLYNKDKEKIIVMTIC